MSNPDSDDIDDETMDRWYEELRPQVRDYLAAQGVEHGRIGEVPAWSVYPHVSVLRIPAKLTGHSAGT